MSSYPAERTRNRPPELILPWEQAEYAATLADRPPRCSCTWVPRFVATRRWVPVGLEEVAAVTGYQPAGFVLKFPNRGCLSLSEHG